MKWSNEYRYLQESYRKTAVFDNLNIPNLIFFAVFVYLWWDSCFYIFWFQSTTIRCRYYRIYILVLIFDSPGEGYFLVSQRPPYRAGSLLSLNYHIGESDQIGPNLTKSEIPIIKISTILCGTYWRPCQKDKIWPDLVPVDTVTVNSSMRRWLLNQLKTRKDCTIWTPTKTYEIGQNRLKLAE